jgi:hypothetical protein
MLTMPTLMSPTPAAALLHPPRGYRVLAWLGLLSNALVIPLAVAWILLDPTWRVAHIAIGAAAVLPTAMLGVVASVALLKWRLWGQILAIIALSMSLAVMLPYGIVRLALLSEGRPVLAVAAPLLWTLNVVILIFWCRPAIRRYLL